MIERVHQRHRHGAVPDREPAQRQQQAEAGRTRAALASSADQRQQPFGHALNHREAVHRIHSVHSTTNPAAGKRAGSHGRIVSNGPERSEYARASGSAATSSSPAQITAAAAPCEAAAEPARCPRAVPPAGRAPPPATAPAPGDAQTAAQLVGGVLDERAHHQNTSAISSSPSASEVASSGHGRSRARLSTISPGSASSAAPARHSAVPISGRSGGERVAWAAQ